MFPKRGDTPKSSILIGCSIINHPFWDTPSFGNTQKSATPFAARPDKAQVATWPWRFCCPWCRTKHSWWSSHDSVVWDRWKLGSLGWDQWLILTPIYPVYDQIGEFFSTIPRKPNPSGSMYGIYLGGGFKYFLFSPLFGEDSHVDQYFSDGLKTPTRYVYTYPA